MNKTLIVAEKPSVAGNIASVLGANNRSDTYYEGNGFIVSWCFGHLLTLMDSKDYDPSMEKWELDKFPFIPPSFHYKVKDDSGVKKQYKALAKLMNEADLIINACDADREGETIFYLVYRESKSTKPVKRLWVSEQTPADIKQGMDNLIDNSKMFNLQASGEARQIADWLIGINLTSVATLKCGNGTLLRCGRVILPTLKLIYDRHMEIANFKPTPFYELKASFEVQNGVYNGLFINSDNCTRFEKKEDLEGILKQIKGKNGKVIDKIVKPSKENPKKLFNLTDLQGYITSKYDGWSAEKVLNVAQSLYEKKFLSYPRTSSRYLESTLVSKMEKVLDAVKGDCQVKFENKKSVFDSSKVESHSAITPTYIVPTSLSQDEKIIYEEVKKRFISQFMNPAEYEVTEIKTLVDNHLFLTKGKLLVKEGWKALYTSEQSEPEEGEEPNIPNILKDETVEVEDAALLSKKTSPPKPFSEETLLKAMETCGRNIDEDDIQHILEGFQLGTPATRAQILKNIFSVGYAEKKGKSICLTSVGMSLIKNVPLAEFYNVNFTGLLEKKLKDIELGKLSKDIYLEEIKTIVNDSVSKLKNVNAVVGVREEKETLGQCPGCGSPIHESDKSYYCSNFKNGCSFSIWKENSLLTKFGIKKVQKSLLKKLLNLEPVTLYVNFSVHIIVSLIKDDSDRWSLQFSFPSAEESKEMRDVLGCCPDCGKPVYETQYSYACDGKKTGRCSFSISKENPLLAKFKINNLSKGLISKLLRMSEEQIKLSPAKFVKAKLEKDDKGKWVVKFTFLSEEENLKLREVLGQCPECGANVYEDNFSFKCEHYSNGCSFALWKGNRFFEKHRKTLTKANVKALLKNGKVEIWDFYSEKTCSCFGAVIGLEKNDKYWHFKLLSFFSSDKKK